MKRKRTKSVIAMILVAVFCLTAGCPAVGAEAVEGVTTALEAAVEEDTEESDVQERAEGSAGEEEPEQVKEAEEAEDEWGAGEMDDETSFTEENVESSAEAVLEEDKFEKRGRRLNTVKRA